MYFSKHEDEEVQLKAVTGLGKWDPKGGGHWQHVYIFATFGFPVKIYT